DSRLENVQVFELAIAASTEDRFLKVSSTDWITHALNLNGDKASAITVHCMTLDQVMQGIEQCALLKLDCEGSEYEIIYGSAPETIGKIKRIVAEYHEAPGGVSNGQELMNFLRSRSFAIDWHRAAPFGEGNFCATRHD